MHTFEGGGVPSESYSRMEPQYVLLRQSADKAIERFPSNQTTLPLNLRLYRAFIFYENVFVEQLNI